MRGVTAPGPARGRQPAARRCDGASLACARLSLAQLDAARNCERQRKAHPEAATDPPKPHRSHLARNAAVSSSLLSPTLPDPGPWRAFHTPLFCPLLTSPAPLCFVSFRFGSLDSIEPLRYRRGWRSFLRPSLPTLFRLCLWHHDRDRLWRFRARLRVCSRVHACMFAVACRLRVYASLAAAAAASAFFLRMPASLASVRAARRAW